MSAEAVHLQLPQLDFSGVDPSAPGAGAWPAVRAQVMHALATFGCFDAHYPALTPQLRAALFRHAVRPLFALPADAKRRNWYGPEKPFHGYLGEPQGLDGQESLAIADASEPDAVRDLMWPDGGGDASFWLSSQRGGPWRGEADRRAGGGGAEDGAGGARGGQAPRAAERVDMAPVPDVGVQRRRGEEGQARRVPRIPPGHQRAQRRVPARGGGAGGAGQSRGVDPRQAVADVARRHGRQRAPGMDKRPPARAISPGDRPWGCHQILCHPVLDPSLQD